MKKFLCSFLIVLFVFSTSACTKQDQDRPLIVGSDPFSGYFIPSDGLSSSASDASIRTLLHDGGTLYLDDTGEMKINKTVIKEYERMEQEDGSVQYSFILNDLSWSDGEQITADDYIFAFLLAASPAFAQAGALDTSGESLAGYWDYYDGVSDVFAGVTKLSDTSFALHIDAASLPYYWELALVNAIPYPMHALTQEGEHIVSDASGSFFDGDMEKAVENFMTTYNETQSPNCGPYTLAAYENGQVTLKRNPSYMGDPEGNKPVIENIVVKEVFSDTAMDALLANEIHLLDPVMESDKIDAGRKGVEEGALQSVSYERNGYGIFSMKTDQGATSEVEVRRAIAFLLDREALVQDVIGGYGNVIDSDYALCQWMVKESDDLQLPYTYALSIKKANEQLDASSYRYEADGTTLWDSTKAETGYYRYNANKEMLSLRHLATDHNPVSDIIEAQLMKNAMQVGIAYQIDRVDDAALMDAYYFSSENGEPTTYNAFTLGTEYGMIPDPYFASFACEYVNTSANPSNYCNTKMDELMSDLRHTDAKDKEGFKKAWKAYIAYFNEEVPQIPLYTSTYYSFASHELTGFAPNTYNNWATKISTLSWK